MSSASGGFVNALSPTQRMGARPVPTTAKPPIADSAGPPKAAASGSVAMKAVSPPQLVTPLVRKATIDSPVAVDTDTPPARASWRKILEYRYAPTLISLILHCAVVMILGLITVAATSSSGTFLAGAFSSDETALSAPLLSTEAPAKSSEPSGGSPTGFESSVSDTIASLKIPVAVEGTTAIGAVDLSAALGGGGSGEGDDLPALGSSKSASFFGLSAKGSKFVFVIDSSISMWGPRWIDLRKEVIRAVRKLDKDQYFFVICFDMGSISMYGDEGIEKDFAKAEEANFRKLEAWLQLHTLGPGTRATTSMVEALKLKPDAIFLLTDGDFQDNVLQTLRTNNRNKAKKRKITVNTIGFHSNSGAPVLMQIASENYGRFQYVAPPVNMPFVPMMRFPKGARVYPPQSIEEMMAVRP